MEYLAENSHEKISKRADKKRTLAIDVGVSSSCVAVTLEIYLSIK